MSFTSQHDSYLSSDLHICVPGARKEKEVLQSLSFEMAQNYPHPKVGVAAAKPQCHIYPAAHIQGKKPEGLGKG
jgi:hypothetical protein